MAMYQNAGKKYRSIDVQEVIALTAMVGSLLGILWVTGILR